MAGLTDDQRLNLDQVELWNCRNAFEFVCPCYFESLTPTEDPAVRYCDVCKEKVYLSKTPLDFITHGELGHCVAIPEGFALIQAMDTRPIGRPDPQFVADRKMQVQEIRAWWREVLDSKPGFAQEAMGELEAVAKRRKV